MMEAAIIISCISLGIAIYALMVADKAVKDSQNAKAVLSGRLIALQVEVQKEREECVEKLRAAERVWDSLNNLLPRLKTAVDDLEQKQKEGLMQ